MVRTRKLRPGAAAMTDSESGLPACTSIMIARYSHGTVTASYGRPLSPSLRVPCASGTVTVTVSPGPGKPDTGFGGLSRGGRPVPVPGRGLPPVTGNPPHLIQSASRRRVTVVTVTAGT